MSFCSWSWWINCEINYYLHLEFYCASFPCPHQFSRFQVLSSQIQANWINLLRKTLVTEDGSAQFVKTSQIRGKIMFGIMSNQNIFQTRFPTIVHLYNVERCFTHFKQYRSIKVANTSSDKLWMILFQLFFQWDMMQTYFFQWFQVLSWQIQAN